MNTRINGEKKYFKIGIYLIIITSSIIIYLLIFYKKEQPTGLGCISVQNQINIILEEKARHSAIGISKQKSIDLKNRLESQLDGNKKLNCGISEEDIREAFD